MKKKITILTTFIIVFLIGGMGNSPVMAQNPPPVHGIGEVYQYDTFSYSTYNDFEYINAYDANNTNIYTFSDTISSNYTGEGMTRLTFLGPEYNYLVERYSSTYNNGTPTLDQNPYGDFVYVLDDTNQSEQNSYSYATFEWSQDYGVTMNSSYGYTNGPNNYFYRDIYSISFNQTYSMLFGEMYETPGVYELYNYLYYLGFNQIIQFTLTVEVSNIMVEFNINGQPAMYSVNLVNVTSAASVVEVYNTTIYLGNRWDASSPYGTFPVNVNTTYYETYLLYFDAVDTRLLEKTYSRDQITDFRVDSTQPVYFPGNNGTTSNVSISLYGGSYYSDINTMSMTEFHPAPVPEGNNRLMKGDKLEFNTYLNENLSSYDVSTASDFNGSSTYWSQRNSSVVGFGTSTLEVVYHKPGSFGALIYGSMDLYGDEVYSDVYTSDSYSWQDTGYFFDFLPYVMSSDTRDIVFQPEPYYYASQIPYDMPLPLVNTSVEYDQLGVFINGYERTLDVELDISMYYLEFNGEVSNTMGPPAPPGPSVQQFNSSTTFLNLTAFAYVINAFDVNTGAFVGRAEELYADYLSDTYDGYSDRYQDVSIESVSTMLLAFHPYFYKEPPTSTTSTAENTTDTSVNTTSTTQTTNSSTSSEPSNTSSIAPPANPLPGFEFSVVTFSIAGIYVIARRRR